MSINSPIEKLTMVATKTLEGAVVHTEFGIALDKVKGIRRAAEATLLNLRYLKGTEVGIEWRNPDGSRNPISDIWAEECYVPVSDK